MVAATRAGRWAWGVVAIVAGVATALCATAGGLLVLRGELRVLWVQPPSILYGYWITAGAWRRAGRGGYGLGPGPEDDEPGLSAVRAARWTLIAAASMVAVLLALGIQVAIARS
jgi:hypothetical protein